MNAFVLLGWGIVGWCGNEPKPPIPNPRKDLAAFIGGLLGGLLVYYGLRAPETLGAIEFIATAIGAYAGGRVLSDIVDRVAGGKH